MAGEEPVPLCMPPVEILPIAAASLRDFADRWPAMVVKELRQGLRARGFVIPFLLLHGLVLTAVALEYLLSRSGATASALLRAAAGEPGVFWLAVYAVVAGVIPLQLMDSLRGPRRVWSSTP